MFKNEKKTCKRPSLSFSVDQLMPEFNTFRDFCNSYNISMTEAQDEKTDRDR